MLHNQPMFPAAKLSPASDGGCSTPMRGNADQRGGGDNFIQVYTSKTRSIATAKPRVNGYNFDGCYPDDEYDRTLPNRIDSISGDQMTLEACTSACAAQGMDQAGVAVSQLAPRDPRRKRQGGTDALSRAGPQRLLLRQEHRA